MTNNFSKYLNPPNLALILILVICAYIIPNMIWSHQSSVIFGDGTDYYSYLIAFFIKHNPAADINNGGMVLETPTGGINVHTSGVALLMMPFFLLGLFFASVLNFPLDGYSEPFQKMATLSSFIYCFVGLIFLKKYLQQIHINPKIIFVVLLSLFFGTNLLNYALNESAMAHSYSFFLISMFLYLSNRIYNESKYSLIPVAFLVFALIILVRPINALILLFVPFLSHNFSEFLSKTKALFAQKKMVSLGLLIFIAVLSIQSIIWFMQNGKLFQNSYSGNSFYFSDPHPLLMLFSFNSGFFIYTPLCLVMLFGLFPLFKTNRYKFYTILLFLILCIYVFSSYWGYTYFDGLGIRTFVDFYPVFAILFAILLQQIINSKLRFIATPLVLIAVFLNLVFCYQYKNGIMKAAGMSYEKFAYIFLKTNKAYGDSIGGVHDLSPLNLKYQDKIVTYSNDFDKPETYPDKSFNYALCSGACGLENYRFTKAYDKIHVKVKLDRKELNHGDSYNVILVCSVTSPGNDVKTYQACRINDVPDKNCCDWRTQSFEINVYGNFEANDKLSVHVINPDNKAVLIDNFNLEVYNISS